MTTKTRSRKRTKLARKKPPLIVELGLLSLDEAADQLGVDRSSAWRYCRIGRSTRSGQQVFLRATDFGSRLYFDPADLIAFGKDVAAAQRRPAPNQENPR